MPRFGILDDDDAGFLHSVREGNTTDAKSSMLSCVSPDARSVHLIHNNSIETHSLPLKGTFEEEDIQVSSNEERSRAIIRTSLPFKVDEDWVELVCVEGERMPQREYKDGCLWTVLPLLCLYSRKSIHLLKLGYPSDNNSPNDDVIEAFVMEYTQPFQRPLMEYGEDATVVRVRSAPFRRLGFATSCPSGSMAALISSRGGSNGCCLCLYHGESKEITQPLEDFSPQYGEVLEEEPHGFVDFSFGQSNTYSLLATLSVHLLKSNGEVWGASPILFDGSMIPTAEYYESCDVLGEIYDDPSSGEDKQRQCHAAEFFCQEAFVAMHPQGNVESSHRVSRLHGGDTNRSTLWPVQLQGPLFTVKHENSMATCIEPFFCRNLVGMALASTKGLDFCILGPTALLPRFTYEEKALELNAAIETLCWVVEHVSLEGSTTKTCRLVRDPVSDIMLHCITDRGVMTVTTYALREASAQIMKAPASSGGSVPTRAWMGVELSKQSDVCVSGALVSGDAHLGHVLIVFLSSGQLTAVNLTEARVRYESKQLVQQEGSNKNTSSDTALQNMEATTAFHEELETSCGTIESGLLGMSKISGSSTDVKNIDAGLLATALKIKQDCEENVVVPLKLLKKKQTIRLSEMKKIIIGQMKQLKGVQQSLQECKDRLKNNKSQMKVIEERSKLLAVRSDSVLQASKDLKPSLTEADLKYFQSLRTTKARCDRWENDVENLRQQTKDYNHVPSPINFTPKESRDVQNLLAQQDEIITKNVRRVERTQAILRDLINKTGLVTQDANFREDYYSPSGGE
mmetsp:Transcript_11338/g.16652  ORF Transcript_11338/g.16652 Transcript_11338/m.16652 type:complete len:798 (+) Transcript_11338:108-2501(+)|eukprot:CAMPEP_0194230124 /NCGR_PEP_ID=MMETSP0156-20130528/44246_1 /TAXON_ID=33649 /ORGANISM="Thalassionema nitzschioides, Strain L26-B" /LENGTH=797 /DNA_ID=CAMNT_0038962697 /DNA_START=45 /DNA_END=2438 /DNA_ORIENTATION=-